MSHVRTPRVLYAQDENGNDTDQQIATMVDAQQREVDLVLRQDPQDEDGRSQFVWLRLANGDLVLACFPQADTYEQVSDVANDAANEIRVPVLVPEDYGWFFDAPEGWDGSRPLQ